MPDAGGAPAYAGAFLASTKRIAASATTAPPGGHRYQPGRAQPSRRPTTAQPPRATALTSTMPEMSFICSCAAVGCKGAGDVGPVDASSAKAERTVDSAMTAIVRGIGRKASFDIASSFFY